MNIIKNCLSHKKVWNFFVFFVLFFYNFDFCRKFFKKILNSSKKLKQLNFVICALEILRFRRRRREEKRRPRTTKKFLQSPQSVCFSFFFHCSSHSLGLYGGIMKKRHQKEMSNERVVASDWKKKLENKQRVPNVTNGV